MARQWWDKPVTIETSDVGRLIEIDSIERAAQYMLEEWPAMKSGKSFEMAKMALIDAHDGKISPNEARHIFLLAIAKAGIFFRE